ncbi:B12-binding domain-containing radical SAM protein [Marinilabilia rubra]|uniref:Uncharacterized protein n=1 Tax=Marinilabilia rubra TaxID=2162893 RepID=A0A2U2B3I7_9BACT|nr:radical SAM protein [Marinilabilia rubra]PWD97625.1 hypothetical protein DDZ16_19755 [Marinilabilia rubra]
MNILLVYSIQKSIAPKKPLKGNEDVQLGLAQISAVLKEEGHNTSLLVIDRKNDNNKTIETTINDFSPGMVCYTAVDTEFEFIKKTAKEIKDKFGLFSVLGGVHVTLNPNESYLDIFDILCIGEGEYALLELASKIEKQEDYSQISNLWVKKAPGTIVKNPTRPFIQNLDSLPFLDREIWAPWILEKNSKLTILLGRGCPYNCTYCCNHKLKKIANGGYVRMRSPENIIAEIEELAKKYPAVNTYFLEIETLGSDLKWLRQLCKSLEHFNRKRPTPFNFEANLRIYKNLDLDGTFSNLKRAGFSAITIGLESGSERIRSEVLKRFYSNNKIIEAVKKAREYGIKVGIFNLIGLPTETYHDFLETLHLNQIIQPDWHATSIFFPYEGTQLHETAFNLGILPKKLSSTNERQKAVLDLPGFPQKQIQREFDNFHFNVYTKKAHPNPVKLLLFFIQKYVGHNTMANIKNQLIKLNYRLGLETKLLNIIQKL